MIKKSSVAAITFATVLVACATQPVGKPVLTASASDRIARQCGAAQSDFHRNKPKLPYVTFILKPGELITADRLSPTVECIGKELDGYQREYFGYRPAPQPAN